MIREIPPEGGAGPSGEKASFDAVAEQLGHPPDVERIRRTDGPVYELISEQEKSEQVRGGGHALRRHCAGTDAYRLRAFDGTTSVLDGEKAAYIPEHATGFTSREALMAAAARSWVSPKVVGRREDMDREFHTLRAAGRTDELKIFCEERAIGHFNSAEDALGPQWRSYVEGYSAKSRGEKETEFSDNTRVKTVWKISLEGKWYIETCYPKPK